MNATAKHTPGPWRAEIVKGWGGDYCIMADGPKPIFKAVKPAAYYTDYAPGSEPGSVILSDEIAAKQGRYVATKEIKAELDAVEAANARLIAAAPELLAIAKECLELAKLAESLCGCRGDDDYVWGIQERLNAVIAKAEGR